MSSANPMSVFDDLFFYAKYAFRMGRSGTGRNRPAEVEKLRLASTIKLMRYE
ncbi:MAG: hypothetical protein Q9177_003406 [Variospora cf. flavescens]